MLSVIAKLTALPAEAEEVARLLAEYVEWVAANEASTLKFACLRSIDSPCDFRFFERYADEPAFRAHSNSRRFVMLVAALQGKLQGPLEIDVCDEIAMKL